MALGTDPLIPLNRVLPDPDARFQRFGLNNSKLFGQALLAPGPRIPPARADAPAAAPAKAEKPAQGASGLPAAAGKTLAAGYAGYTALSVTAPAAASGSRVDLQA